jgi:hypothetical protein
MSIIEDRDPSVHLDILTVREQRQSDMIMARSAERRAESDLSRGHSS